MATMEKTFNCFKCGQQIKLERKADNSGWLYYNLDGSAHVDQKNNFGLSKTLQKLEELGKKIDELATEVRGLREDIMSKS